MDKTRKIANNVFFPKKEQKTGVSACPISYTKLWGRESGDQPGMMLEVMAVEGLRLMRARTSGKVA